MNQLEKRKPVIWLAGDSTMQSYPLEKRPQWGWGEKVAELLESAVPERRVPEGSVLGGSAQETINQEEIVNFHRADSPFEHQRRYEGRHFIVDNCAMSGRSTKTFREDGRLRDIEEHIQQGDYLLIQFGHNDAATSKQERYVPLEKFRESLADFVKVAFAHDATPIFLSAIVLCPGQESETGEAGEISRLLPEYGKVMKEYAEELKIPYIDMHRLTGDYIKDMSQKEAEELYLPDHVHLVENGAMAYANMAVKEFTHHIRCR